VPHNQRQQHRSAHVRAQEQRNITPTKSQDYHNAEESEQHDNIIKVDNNHHRQAMQQPDARAPEAFDSSAMALLSQTTVTAR
jgi:hypothetical protein